MLRRGSNFIELCSRWGGPDACDLFERSFCGPKILCWATAWVGGVLGSSMEVCVVSTPLQHEVSTSSLLKCVTCQGIRKLVLMGELSHWNTLFYAGPNNFQY